MDIGETDRKTPRWLDLADGVSVFALPVTTPISYAARSRADHMVVQAIEGGEAVSRAGGHVTGLPDLSDEVERNGVWTYFYLIGIAELTVSDWKGVQERGADIPFDSAKLAAVIADPVVSNAFSQKQLQRHNRIAREGN
ncbi:hypothetical protein [uncultured Devosia sp.]|uniref:hypothetical protein n=1 Tax=uncultured Devosia sp. TaxID=211434 RepID=UPI002618C090|nr:hypothetical protein [uncultured Devosia sp.]